MVMGVVVCACDVRTETLAAETGDPVSDCDYPGDRTAATFEALTANVWNGLGCDYAGDELPPPCDTLTLSADGTYSWVAISDYVERDDAGRWTFYEAGGLTHVAFDDGSFIAVDVQDDQLTFLGLPFSKGTAMAPGDLGRLSDLDPSPLYCGLTRTAWTKTNPFDLAFRPDAITFHEDGTFEAGYRERDCSHGGVWDLYTESFGTGAPTSPQRVETILYPRSDDNLCDTRGDGSSASIAPSNGVPQWRGETLVFHSASYHPDDGLTREQLLVYDNYGGMLETVVETDAFEPGQALELGLRFVNVAPGQTLSPVAFVVTGMADDGIAETLLELPLQGMLATDEELEASAVLEMPALPEDGALRLGFATVFEDGRGGVFDAAQFVSLEQ